MGLSSIFGSEKAKEEGGDHWLTISDLMSGLMIVFLFISIALMQDTRNIVEAYKDNQASLYKSLNEEFANDLKSWGAEIDETTLSFNFNSPDVLFDNGSGDVKPAFKNILDDFFPRYLKILNQYINYIEEVRIEGHTSSQWNADSSDSDAYFYNMKLSQIRTRSVLEYVYNLKKVEEHKIWIKSHIAAVGLSSSKLIYNEDGKENAEKSRRVSFRVITNAESQIRKILATKK